MNQTIEEAKTVFSGHSGICSPSLQILKDLLDFITVMNAQVKSPQRVIGTCNDGIFDGVEQLFIMIN